MKINFTKSLATGISLITLAACSTKVVTKDPANNCAGKNSCKGSTNSSKTEKNYSKEDKNSSKSGKDSRKENQNSCKSKIE